MAYSLATSYMGESLLSGFSWFDGADPTHGFVSYQSRANAQAKGLFSVNKQNGAVRLGVDTDNVYPVDQGRPSIRLESKESYNHGLFIADFLHMPPSQCGLWPAFWAYGPGWPNGGELDIIEGANTAYRNTISAHTAEGCTVSETLQSNALGDLQKTTCDVGGDNVGCGYYSPSEDVSAYGDGFNAVNGGVYAMQWDEDAIKIWHFARGAIPQDIEQKNPDPSNWGKPTASFGGSSCDVDKYFKDMKLVINIDFCGDWAGGVWGKTDSCNTYAPTCNEYVAKNPQAFANAYWDIRFIDAYMKGDANSSSESEPTTTTTMTTTSTTTVLANNTGAGSSNKSNVPSEDHKPYGNSTSSRRPAPFIPKPSPAPPAPVPVNPGSIGNSTYLGCYGSSTGFETFKKVKESEDMTVDMCVELCEGSMFAGVFETQCFCAEVLDADTRATNGNDGVCDHICPGDDDQMCGGIATRIGAVSNTTAPDSSSKDLDSSKNGTALPTNSSSASASSSTSASVKDSSNQRFGVSDMNTTTITKTRTTSITSLGSHSSSSVGNATISTSMSVAASSSTSREDGTTTMSSAAAASSSSTTSSDEDDEADVNDKFNVNSNNTTTTTAPANKKYAAALDSNSTSTATSTSSSSAVAVPSPKLRHSNITAINIMNTPSRRARGLTRRIPNNILLTVYGFVKQERPPPPPPPMAPGANVTFSFTDVVTAYKTVVPIQATGGPAHHGKYIVDEEPSDSDASSSSSSASDDKVKGDMGGAYKEAHLSQKESQTASHPASHPAVATKVIVEEDCGCEEGETSATHPSTHVAPPPPPPAETTPCTETHAAPAPPPPAPPAPQSPSSSIKTITSEPAPSQPTAPVVVTAGAAGGALGELRYTLVLGLVVLAVAVLL